MWLISNRTPYMTGRGWVQDKDANKIWVVAVKATFDVLADGRTRLADQQLPVLQMAEPHGDLGSSSLRYDADLLQLKPATDVLVNGSACAPAGRLATRVDVELQAGPIRKTLRVFGDRQWRPGLAAPAISSPRPFERMPIVYERAFGGWDRYAADPARHRLDLRNPVGCGLPPRAGGLSGTAVPNVEYPGQLIGSWRDRPAPAGLNAVDVAWSPRRELAGTYDQAWRESRFPLWAEDFDPKYALCAPADQQLPGFLRGGEVVRVTNMCPAGALAFALPRIHLAFQTRFGHERVEHRGRLASVVVEPEAPRVILTWQTSLTCNHRAEELDLTVVSEKRLL